MTTRPSLSQSTLDRFARVLVERRDAATDAAEAFFAEAHEAQATADNSDRFDSAFPVGAGSDESYALAYRALDAAREAEAALGRLEDGSFGTCLQCEAPIPGARLRALPATVTCVGCADDPRGRRSAGGDANGIRA
jgi:RNA polymerase-binding transcription factor DksA